MASTLKLLSASLIAVFLASCGGGGGGGTQSGGGGGTTPPPSASPPNSPTITSSLASALEGQSITFAATATDPANLALTYAWEFGDGTAGSGATVSKSFSKAGNFIVRVTVTNTASRSASTSITQVVSWRDLTKSWTRRLGQFGSTRVLGTTKFSVDGVTGAGYVVGSVCCRNVFEGQSPIDGEDAFVTRLNPDGSAAWTRVIGGSNGSSTQSFADDRAYAAVVSNDSVYVVGSTDAKIFYGQSTNGSRDIFVVRFSHDGQRIWTKVFGGVADDEALGVTIGKPVGSSNTINVTGVTQSATFQGQPSNGAKDAFVLQIDTNGAVVWARLTGGTGNDTSNGIAIANDGSIYITGSTTSVTLDGQQLNIQEDAFVAKYGSDGSKLWTRLIGGTAFDRSYGIGIDPNDSAVYITGTTNSSSIEGAAANSSSTAGDVFVAKLGSDGSKTWTRTIGDSGTDEGRAISVGSDGSIFVVGFTSSSQFDSKATNGDRDVFITRYAADGTRAYSFLSGGTARDEAYAVSVLADATILVGGISFSPLFDGQQRISSSGSEDAALLKFKLN